MWRRSARGKWAALVGISPVEALRSSAQRFQAEVLKRTLTAICTLIDLLASLVHILYWAETRVSVNLPLL